MACGIYFPDQGSNPGPLYWKHGAWAIGPPRKSLRYFYAGKQVGEFRRVRWVFQKYLMITLWFLFRSCKSLSFYKNIWLSMLRQERCGHSLLSLKLYPVFKGQRTSRISQTGSTNFLSFPKGSLGFPGDSEVWSLGGEDHLEKGMATHSSILAWELPWTEETGRLQSTGLQRIREDWRTFSFTSEGVCILKWKKKDMFSKRQ